MTNKLILKNCLVALNGVDFTDHCASVEIALKAASVDTTNFAGGGKEQQQGLREDVFTLELQQDFSAAEVDATLFPLFNNGTEFLVQCSPTSAAVSATNPMFQATVILMDYNPLAGKPGALSVTKVTLPVQRNTFQRLTTGVVP